MDVIHNSNQNWGITQEGVKYRNNNKFFDVGGVATHEIGHVWGMDHSGTGDFDKNQTMYYATGPWNPDPRSIESDGDIPGIQSLYGAAP